MNILCRLVFSCLAYYAMLCLYALSCHNIMYWRVLRCGVLCYLLSSHALCHILIHHVTHFSAVLSITELRIHVLISSSSRLVHIDRLVLFSTQYSILIIFSYDYFLCCWRMYLFVWCVYVFVCVWVRVWVWACVCVCLPCVPYRWRGTTLHRLYSWMKSTPS